MKSYFEIHGHIVESSVDDYTSPPSPQLGGFVAERPERGRNSAKTESLMSSKFAARDTGESRTHWDDTRKMRVRTALTVAASIALADGPLPIGDSLAVAGLLIYSGWELGHEFRILD